MKTKTISAQETDDIRNRFLDLEYEDRLALHNVWVHVQSLAQAHAPEATVKTYINREVTEERYGADAGPFAKLMFADFQGLAADLAA